MTSHDKNTLIVYREQNEQMASAKYKLKFWLKLKVNLIKSHDLKVVAIK